MKPGALRLQRALVFLPITVILIQVLVIGSQDSLGHKPVGNREDHRGNRFLGV